MPIPLIYSATARAAQIYPAPLLDGTVEAAQKYADRITCSKWWHNNCPPSWLGEGLKDGVPRKILIEEDPDEHAGGLFWTEHLFQRGPWMLPKIELGRGDIYNGNAAIQDPWVILHELAHVWSVEAPGWHGRQFCMSYHKLVAKYLGPDPAFALKLSMKLSNIRLPYRLLS